MHNFNGLGPSDFPVGLLGHTTSADHPQVSTGNPLKTPAGCASAALDQCTCALPTTNPNRLSYITPEAEFVRLERASININIDSIDFGSKK